MRRGFLSEVACRPPLATGYAPTLEAFFKEKNSCWCLPARTMLAD